MKAMILAAGFGTRLKPLTDICPKPLFPVCNRPLLEHSMDLLEKAGIESAAINLHHLSQAVIDRYPDSLYKNMKLRFFVEEKILGTAGGICAAREFLDDGSPFLVLNSDVLSDVNLKEALRFHNERKSALTLVVRRYGPEETYRPIEIDPSGRIVNFLDTLPPSAKEKGERVMFTGIQIMEPEIFNRIPVNRFCGTTEDIFPQMIKEGKPVYGFLHEGCWIDAGTRETYLQANFDALENCADPDEKISGIVHPVLIGKNCDIAPGATIGPYVVLGDGCKIGDGVRIERSVCWEGTVIGDMSHIQDGIIANIKENGYNVCKQ